jgi:hypothetical protein
MQHTEPINLDHSPPFCCSQFFPLLASWLTWWHHTDFCVCRVSWGVAQRTPHFMYKCVDKSIFYQDIRATIYQGEDLGYAAYVLELPHLSAPLPWPSFRLAGYQSCHGVHRPYLETYARVRRRSTRCRISLDSLAVFKKFSYQQQGTPLSLECRVDIDQDALTRDKSSNEWGWSGTM